MPSPLDPEQNGIFTPNPPDQTTPLLPSSARYLTRLRRSRDWIDCHIVKIHGEETYVWRIRNRLQNFLSSKWGHYFVLALVAVDIACIFATFLITLHVCEHGGEKGFSRRKWKDVDEVLSGVSLTISCLFVAELIGSLFAFGPR